MKYALILLDWPVGANPASGYGPMWEALLGRIRPVIESHRDIRTIHDGAYLVPMRDDSVCGLRVLAALGAAVDGPPQDGLGYRVLFLDSYPAWLKAPATGPWPSDVEKLD